MDLLVSSSGVLLLTLVQLLIQMADGFHSFKDRLKDSSSMAEACDGEFTFSLFLQAVSSCTRSSSTSIV